jgi:hypothetical protein
MVSVLTDCPHREKLGWLEQTYLNAPTVLYNRDAAPLYDKLVHDIAEAQQGDGMVPGIAPEYVAFQDAQGQDQVWRNSPEWGAAAVLAPWEAYRFSGDATVLAAAWPAAQRYCAYLAQRSREGILDFGMGDWYDVGPNEPGEAQLTSRALVGTATYIACLQTMDKIAARIGQGHADYAALAVQVTRQFNARFLDPATGRYERGSQTAQAMPLALGLAPPAQQAGALAALIAAIRREGNGVTAGDIGYRYVLAALAAAGRDDVILAMLRVRDRPGYALQLARGATALTEAWDANPTKSLNHFMLGQAEDWFYRRLGGLDIDHARGMDAALRLAPQMPPDIAGAQASHRLREGVLSCAWQRKAGQRAVTVCVPPGRQARLSCRGCLPAIGANRAWPRRACRACSVSREKKPGWPSRWVPAAITGPPATLVERAGGSQHQRRGASNRLGKRRRPARHSRHRWGAGGRPAPGVGRSAPDRRDRPPPSRNRSPRQTARRCG